MTWWCSSLPRLLLSHTHSPPGFGWLPWIGLVLHLQRSWSRKGRAVPARAGASPTPSRTSRSFSSAPTATGARSSRGRRRQSARKRSPRFASPPGRSSVIIYAPQFLSSLFCDGKIVGFPETGSGLSIGRTALHNSVCCVLCRWSCGPLPRDVSCSCCRCW